MCALRTYVPYPTFPTQSFFTEKKTDMEERDGRKEAGDVGFKKVK